MQLIHRPTLEFQELGVEVLSGRGKYRGNFMEEGRFKVNFEKGVRFW